ncbi:MFS transporter [Novosphingobium sp. G106]|uniref:MFS transporter n=1 Tax=Novosphingobium sp. G106 TaxID=2849500 RepID=UPI001C2D4CEB|nr:MFS transporter [Novosphingobium sp. G106]MBV1688940.1 MFS transporter [Novosphingobium sp. G106]
MRWLPDLTRTVAILLALYALSLLDRNLISLMVAPMRADLGLSETQIGLLQGYAFAVFYVVCGVPLGLLADRAPRKFVIFGGVLLWSLATVSCGLARTFPELLLARFAVGVGEAALIPAAYSLLGDIAPRSQLALAMAVFTTGAMVGSGLSIILGGVLVQLLTAFGPVELFGVSFEPWQTTFVLVGAVGIPLTLLSLLLPEPRSFADGDVRRPDSQEAAGFVSFVGSHKGFLAVHFLGYAAIYTASAGGSGWAPVYLQQTFGWSTARIGAAVGAGVVVCGLAGSLLAGHWIQRQLQQGNHAAPLSYFAVGAIVVALLGGIAPWTGSGTTFVLLYVSTSFFTVCAAAAGTALTLVTPPPFRGRVAALFTMVFNLIGAGTGPLIVGATSQHFAGDHGLSVALTVTYVGSGMAAAGLLWIGARIMPPPIAPGSFAADP